MASKDYTAGALVFSDFAGTGADAVSSMREEGIGQGILTHIAKWDPILLGPIIEGYRADDEASRRDAALGPAPEFKVPSSYDQYTALMQERAQRQMPGYDEMSAGIQEGTAADMAGVGQLSSGPEAIMGANAVYTDQANQLRDLGMRASQWQQEAQMGAMGALQGRGQYEQQQYEYNQWLPWQIAKNEIASLRGAGQQMSAQGSDTMGAAAITGASMFSS